MIVRRLQVGWALLLSLLVAFVGFAYVDRFLRTLETTTVLSFFSGSDAVTVLDGHVFQVLPDDADAFRATLTPYCSSLISILALAAIAVCVLRGTLPRRLLALSAAATLVVACNILRVTASIWVGLEVGPGGLVLFHDWVGTIFGLLYTMGGFFLMLFLLLPSPSAHLPRAARVSDVL